MAKKQEKPKREPKPVTATGVLKEAITDYNKLRTSKTGRLGTGFQQAGEFFKTRIGKALKLMQAEKEK